MKVKSLVNAALSEGDVMLEIYQVVLVEKVIHLWVHSLYDMVTYHVTWVGFHLIDTLLHVLVKVPSYYAVNLIFVVVGNNLEPVSVKSL